MNLKKYNLVFFNIAIIFFLNSCSYFDQEEENILPGKRESVFITDDKILKKANKKVKILPPKDINSWTQQHQNIRNHLYHFKSNPNLKLLKKIKLGNINFKNIQYVPPPVFLENVIYYCDNKFNIFAKSLETGKVLWRTRLTLEDSENFSFVGGISLSNDSIFITTGLGNIYKIDRKKGNIIWFKRFFMQFSRPPLVYKNKVFVISDDNQVFALSTNSGDTIWSHIGNIEEVSIIGGSKPAIDNEILVVTYSSGEIFALNQNDGSIVWFDNSNSGSIFSRTNVNDIQSPLTIENKTLYVPTFSEKLLVYDLKDGKKKWDLKLSSVNPLVISGDVVYVLDTTGKLMCLEKVSGNLTWAVQLKIKKKNKEIVWYGPLLSTNKLILVSSDGLVLSLSPFSGKILSKINFDESFLNNPIQVKKNIFLISKQGTLFILG